MCFGILGNLVLNGFGSGSSELPRTFCWSPFSWAGRCLVWFSQLKRIPNVVTEIPFGKGTIPKIIFARLRCYDLIGTSSETHVEWLLPLTHPDWSREQTISQKMFHIQPSEKHQAPREPGFKDCRRHILTQLAWEWLHLSGGQLTNVVLEIWNIMSPWLMRCYGYRKFKRSLTLRCVQSWMF